jgi:hypothetical protein
MYPTYRLHLSSENSFPSFLPSSGPLGPVKGNVGSIYQKDFGATYLLPFAIFAFLGLL